MEQIHKDALRRSRLALVTDLDVDIIYDDLLAKDIFTPLMMEYIKVSFLSMYRMIKLMPHIRPQ